MGQYPLIWKVHQRCTAKQFDRPLSKPSACIDWCGVSAVIPCVRSRFWPDSEWFRAATVGIMCDTMCHVLVHFCEGTSALCNARPPDRASRCMSSSPLLLPCQHLVGIESGVQGILDSNGYGAPLRKSCIRIVSSSQPMKNPSTWIRTFLKYVDSWVVMNIWTEFMLQWIFTLPQVPLTLIWLRCCHRCFISLQHFFSLCSLSKDLSASLKCIFWFSILPWTLEHFLSTPIFFLVSPFLLAFSLDWDLENGMFWNYTWVNILDMWPW